MSPYSPKMLRILALVQKHGIADYEMASNECQDMERSHVATYMTRLTHNGCMIRRKAGKRYVYSVTDKGTRVLSGEGEQIAAGISGIGPFPFAPVVIPRVTSVWELAAA